MVLVQQLLKHSGLFACLQCCVCQDDLRFRFSMFAFQKSLACICNASTEVKRHERISSISSFPLFRPLNSLVFLERSYWVLKCCKAHFCRKSCLWCSRGCRVSALEPGFGCHQVLCWDGATLAAGHCYALLCEFGAEELISPVAPIAPKKWIRNQTQKNI